jgi:hypothetical protein
MGKVVNIKQYQFDKWASERAQAGLYVPAYCDPKNEFVGCNYDRDADIKDIARSLRKQYRAEFPGFKFSVRISRFSGGQSIDVDIKSLPDDVDLWNPDYAKHLYIWGFHRGPIPPSRYSEIVQAVRESAEAMLQSHNRDNSDSMSDYFDVKFYGHVGVDVDAGKPRYRVPTGDTL